MTDSAPKTDSPPQQARRSSITRRSVALGIITVIALHLYTNYTGLVMGSAALVKSQYPMAMLLPFILWVFINIGLKSFRPQWALSSTELLVIYTMTWVSSGIALEGWAAYWASFQAVPTYYASPENGWKEAIFDTLPWWALAETTPTVVQPFFEGLPSGASIPWMGWGKSIFWWLSVSLALLTAGICLSIIFQRQWEEAERLSYPLGQFAQALTSGFDLPGRVPQIFKDKVFWAGFFVVFGVIMWNVIGYFAIGLPRIAIYDGYWGTQVDLARNFPPLILRILPSVVGLTYFCNLELLFSFWALRLLAILKQGLMDRTGFSIGLAGQQANATDILELESHGAMVLLVAWSVWVARKHLRRVWQAAWRPDDAAYEGTVAYRSALIGFGISTVYIMGWIHAAGMSLPVAFLHTLLILAAYFTVAKYTAASGFTHLFPPGVNVHGIKSGDLLQTFVGTANLTREDFIGIGIVNSSAFFGNARIPAWPALPYHFKLLGKQINKSSRLVWIAVWAFAIGAMVSFIGIIYLAYAHGGQNLNLYPFSVDGGSVKAYDAMTTVTLNADRTDFDLGKMGVWMLGILEAVLLVVLYNRFSWWPLHPLGLAFQNTRGIRLYAFSIFLTWAAKSTILRVGGIALYRRASPFFIGLPVGYVAGILVSSIVDFIWFPAGNHWVHTW